MENPNQNQVREIFTTEIGKFYFLDRIVIGEINHGATLTYQKSLEVIEKAKKMYGENTNLAYISNRINPYSVRPTDWLKIYSLKKSNVVSFSIVTSSQSSWANLLLERYFCDTNVNVFNTLSKAISFSKTILDSLEQHKTKAS